MLSAVGLGGSLPDAAPASAKAHVNVQTPVLASEVGAAADVSRSDFGISKASPVAANVLVKLDSPSETPAVRPSAATPGPPHAIAHEADDITSQGPPGTVPAVARRPIAAVKATVPVLGNGSAVRTEEPTVDALPLPDSNVEAPDGDATLPPGSSNPGGPPIAVGPEEIKPTGTVQPGPLQEDGGSANNSSTLPNDSGSQGSEYGADRIFAAAGAAASPWWFQPLNSESGESARTRTAELADPPLIGGQQSTGQTMAESAALDAAFADLFGTQVPEKKDENDNDAAKAVTELVTDRQINREEIAAPVEDDTDDSALNPLCLVSELAPGLPQTVLQMAIDAASADISFALEALDSLLGALDQLGEEAGPWAQAGFTMGMLSTVAAAGGGCEIARRQMKRDRRLTRAEGCDQEDTLPPDMDPMTTLS